MPGENGEYNEAADKTTAETAESEEGNEDPYRDDPNTFGKKPVWQRFIITAAGATVNIVAGFLAMIVLTCMINTGNTRVRAFLTPEQLKLDGQEAISFNTGLCQGDVILEVEGKKVRIYDELSYEIMRKGNEPVDLLVLRDGKEVFLPDVVFPTETVDGQTIGIVDFAPNRMEKSFGKIMNYSWRKSTLIVRMVWESLYDLITGRFSLGAVSGPVGISTAIGNAAKESLTSLLYITVLISINLGVMNLLPIPALDGGRLFTQLIEMVTRKKLPAKVEGLINGIGLMLLLGLSVVILIKDTLQLIF